MNESSGTVAQLFKQKYSVNNAWYTEIQYVGTIFYVVSLLIGTFIYMILNGIIVAVIIFIIKNSFNLRYCLLNVTYVIFYNTVIIHVAYL